ncbi:MAG: Gfo/Idh/MocA family oxidoreductase [Beijerinckiaceae bacterium]|nr:Gfo/Idh/MocA family oxidoreductase [Beijerinckiaceae bacterium]
MTAPPLSVGIIGVGEAGRNVHIPVLRAMPEARIAWIGDINAARLNAAATANGLRAVHLNGQRSELLPCDAVLLAVPIPPRAHYFDLLERAGMAVFAEKPLANTAQEHRRLLSKFDPWRLSVGYQRRQYATTRLLRRLIAERPFGVLTSMCITEGGRATRTGEGGPYQDQSVAEGGGITKNLGCHSLDLAFWITGARRFTMLDRHIDWDGETDRRASAQIVLLEINGNASHDCKLDWTVSSLDRQPNMIELQFEHARLHCPVQPGGSIDVLSRCGNRLYCIDAQDTGGATTINQACYLEWRAVLNGVASRSENEMSASSSMLVAELMDELLSEIMVPCA